MTYVTSLGPDDWVAQIHDCTDPLTAAHHTLTAALHTLDVHAAATHRHPHGRTPGWRLTAHHDHHPDPGTHGTHLRLTPGEVRTPTPDHPTLHPHYPGWAALDLTSPWTAGTHLELYSTDPTWPDPPALHHARTFASAAGLALRRVEQTMNLHRALTTRTLIGQAQGVLMERFDLDPDTALAYLRRISQHGNRPLRDIANDVVHSPRDVWGAPRPPASAGGRDWGRGP